MIKILVTGAEGQLGSSIKLISGKYRDFCFDYTDIKELDICDADSVERYIQLSRPDYIVNCAAYTNVDRAESEPDICYQLNAEAVRNLRDAARQIDAGIIHLSTDYVFSGKQERPYEESDPTGPESIYGKSKLMGEGYLENYANSIIIRTSWLYSQFGKNFVKTIIRKGKENDILEVVSDQKGTPTYASDLAGAILSIIDHTRSRDNSLLSSIYHYSNLGEASWFEFAREIIRLSGLKCQVIPITTADLNAPAPRPGNSVLDKKQICQTFDLQIPHWRDSLSECIAGMKL